MRLMFKENDYLRDGLTETANFHWLGEIFLILISKIPYKPQTLKRVYYQTLEITWLGFENT